MYITLTACSHDPISVEEAIKISSEYDNIDTTTKKIDVLVNEIPWDLINSLGRQDPSYYKVVDEVKGRNFVSIYYSPNDKYTMGGEIWHIVDLDTGEVFIVHRFA